jgi:mono/diheme cytochrome c family protein
MPGKLNRRIAIVALVVSGAFGISSVATSEDAVVAARWYTEQQLEQGQALFLANCATCHGQRAEGTAEWRKTDADGNYPPPPLNGSAHAWHHSLAILERSISMGGVPNGGVMPGFAGKLSPEEMQATIAYFQHFWPDEIYARWLKINSR